jgi:hypothetical protein
MTRDELMQALLFALVRRMPGQNTTVSKEEMTNNGLEGLAIKTVGDEIQLRIVTVTLPPGVHRYPH